MRTLMQFCLTLGLFAFALTLASACTPTQWADPAEPGEELDYASLAERFNRNVDPVDQFRARARIAAEWEDADGQHQQEAGDGLVIFRRPHELALAIDKMGQTVIWTGADAEQYWFFELHEEQMLMRGQHENIGQPCAAELPFAIQPHRLPHLLGLMPLEVPQDPAEHPQVHRDGDHYQFVLPSGDIEMRIDARTWLATRVSILNEQGEPEIISELSSPQRVQLETVQRRDQPHLPSRAEIDVLDDPAAMTFRMGHLSDGRPDRIRDAMFDLNGLIAAHNPREIIVLDERCD